MADASRGIPYWADVGLLPIDLTVLAPVDQLALPGLSLAEVRPQVHVNLGRGEPGLEKAGIPALDLIGAVTGQEAKVGVDVVDVAGGVSDDDGGRALLHGLVEDQQFVMEPLGLRQTVGQCPGATLQLQVELNPGPHQGLVHRLVDEIHATRLQGPDLAQGVGLGGDEDDRDVARGRIGLESRADREAVHFRHHDVQQNQVRFDPLGQQLQGLGPGSGEAEGIVTLEDAEQDLDVQRCIVDDQDVCLGVIRHDGYSGLAGEGHARREGAVAGDG